MPTTIKLKNSVTTTSVPSSLVQGEVAINITDKKVWVGNAATTPIQIAGAGTTGNAAGSNTQVQYNSSGSFAGSANMTFNGTTLTVADLTDSSLTVNRVVYAGTAGNLTNSANFTFNGTTVTMANDASISGLTVGKGAGAVSTNTAVGVSALSGNTSGSSNTAIGWNSLVANTSASNSTAIGQQALNQATGGRNTALGHQAGFGVTTGTQNTYLGAYTASSATGSSNVAVGDTAMYTATTGNNNVAVGTSTLASNTASNNTAVGYQAGYSTTTGTGLTLVGGLGSNSRAAGYSLTSGSYSVAVGAGALGATTTASHNTAVGYDAMNNNTTGADNIALGNRALINNTTGSYNTGLGRDALLSNTTASSNTAVGYQAGYSNTTGADLTAVGYLAGYSNTTGTSNLFLGRRAGYSNTTSGNNTYVGEASGNSTTGNANTFVGNAAGNAITTGSKNTILGTYSGNNGGLDIRTASNYIVLSDGDGNPRQVINNSGDVLIGKTAVGATTTGVQLQPSGLAAFTFDTTGDGPLTQFVNPNASAPNGFRFASFRWSASSTEIGTITKNGSGNVAYNTSSDYRLKENIAPMTGALAKIAQLKPVTYKWKADGSDGQGFIAHELQEVVPDCVNGKKDAVDEEGKPIYQGVDTSFLVATLTAALQEAHGLIKDLQARVDALENK